MSMRECVCCQCSDDVPGYEPDYDQCESCGLYGTEDEFSESKDGICNDCCEKARDAAIAKAELESDMIKEGL